MAVKRTLGETMAQNIDQNTADIRNTTKSKLPGGRQMPTDLQLMLASLNLRLAPYQTFRNYYEGQHRVAFATDKWRNAFGAILRRFALNMCPAVVDALCDRLEVEDWVVETLDGVTIGEANQADPAAQEHQADAKDLNQIILDIRKRNLMDERVGIVHQEATMEGDAYCIVWPDLDTGFPTIYIERAEQITVRWDRDKPNTMEWAAKLWWQPDKHARLTAYYPDRIEKYVTKKPVDKVPERADQFTRWVDTETEEPWPLPNPYGRIPVFHFANNPGSGKFGRSELKDVIPLQDALNKTAMDGIVAGEFVALPQRYVTGLEVDVDDLTGRPKIPFQPGVDRLWQASDPQVKFGEFAAADMSGFIDMKNDYKMDIARVTGTPIHYMSLEGAPQISGIALQMLEVRLLKRAHDRQCSFGNTWADLISFCLMVLGHYNVGVCTKWKRAALVDLLEQAQTLQIKSAVGVGRKQILREWDYTAEQIAQMDEEAAQDAVAQANLGAYLLAAFDKQQEGGGTKSKAGDPSVGGESGVPGGRPVPGVGQVGYQGLAAGPYTGNY